LEKILIAYDFKSQLLEDRKQKIIKIRFKTCKKCGETKPGFKFKVEKRNKDGRSGTCKACNSQKYLKYYYQNRDKILKKIEEYQDNHKNERSIYQKHYRERYREHLKKQAKKWYKKNRKAIKERNLKYYNENKEACRARRRIWLLKNKDKIREYNREYNQNKRK